MVFTFKCSQALISVYHDCMIARLFDSHTHLDFPVFDSDRDELLADFYQQGGAGVIIAGISAKYWSRQIAVCERLPQCYYALGFHPMFDHADHTTCERLLREVLESSKPIAIGECGLDKQASASLNKQLALLRSQLALANEFQLPIILHCRGYHQELLQTLSQISPKYGGVLHAFSGSYPLAMDYIKRGVKLGIGGVISYSRAAKTRRTVAQIALEHLILETDAPDMPLDGYQGQRNTPLQLISVLDVLAKLQAKDRTSVAAQIYENTRSLFKLPL